jgi:PAS domain S-box-containing protein
LKTEDPDPTEKKRAERPLPQLCRPEECYRTIFDNTPDGSLLISQDGPVLAANPEAFKMLGYTPEELRRLEQTSIVDPRHPNFQLLLKEQDRKGKCRVELDFIRKDGLRIPVDLTSAPFTEPNGAKRNLWIFRDNSRHKETAEALARSERFLREVLDSLTSNIAVLDETGTITTINGAWIRFAKDNGCTDESFYLGANYLSVCEKAVQRDRDELAHSAAKGIKKVMKGELDHFLLEYPCHSPMEKRWFVVRVTPLSDQGSSPVVVAHENITGRKLAEEELQSYAAKLKALNLDLEDANERLQKANFEMQEFVFVASHDLQEPLRKIQMFSSLLKRPQGSVPEKKNRDYLERILRAAERMREMIDALLEYSRITTKGQLFTRVDLLEPVRKAVQILDLKVKETGAAVEIKDLPAVEADPLQMVQLFQNLLENALKFRKTDEPPRVMIHGTQADNGWIRILVEDNGIGFEEQHARRIFTPFERLHGRGDFQGTGIGLAICKKIVERHGGTITARSTPGKGSNFIIDLPVRQ